MGGAADSALKCADAFTTHSGTQGKLGLGKSHTAAIVLEEFAKSWRSIRPHGKLRFLRHRATRIQSRRQTDSIHSRLRYSACRHSSIYYSSPAIGNSPRRCATSIALRQHRTVTFRARLLLVVC